jgi:septal ring factor EnvC (AmiA/AmiB activator)
MPRPSTGTNLSLAALQSILESRREEVSKLKKQRAELQRKVDLLDRQIDRIEGDGRGGNGRVRNTRSLNDTLAEVLRDGGKAMKVGDIVDAVKATGYRSNSANFRGIVNQTLIKDKRFVAPERGMYQIKK